MDLYWQFHKLIQFFCFNLTSTMAGGSNVTRIVYKLTFLKLLSQISISNLKRIDSPIQHLAVKYLSPKRGQDGQISGPLAHLALSTGHEVRFFKIVFNVDRQSRADPKYRFDELDGHDFSRLTKKVVEIEYLHFVGSQLLAVSDRQSAQMAVWNAARQGRWQQHKV